MKTHNGATNYSVCRAHSLVPMIEPDGKVYICIDLGGDDKFVIGNIYDDNIEKIWNSKKRQEVIKNIDFPIYSEKFKEKEFKNPFSEKWILVQLIEILDNKLLKVIDVEKNQYNVDLKLDDNL